MSVIPDTQEVVCGQIREQFLEIERVAQNQQSHAFSKDTIIEKLTHLNQYVYNQYLLVSERSISLDYDLNDFFDVESLENPTQFKEFALNRIFHALSSSQQQPPNEQLNQLFESLINSFIEFRSNARTLPPLNIQVNNLNSAIQRINNINEQTFEEILLEDYDKLIGQLDKLTKENAALKKQVKSAVLIRENVEGQKSSLNSTSVQKNSIMRGQSSVIPSTKSGMNAISVLLENSQFEIEQELKNRLRSKCTSVTEENDLEEELGVRFQRDERSSKGGISSHARSAVVESKENITNLLLLVKHSMQRLDAFAHEVPGVLGEGFRREIANVQSRIALTAVSCHSSNTSNALEDWNNSLESMRAHFEEREGELKQEMDSGFAEIHRLSLIVSACDGELESIRGQNVLLLNEIQSKEAVIFEQNRKVSELQIEVEAANDKYVAAVAAHEERVDSIEAEVQLHKQNCISASIKVEQAVEENSQLSARINQLHEEKNELMKKWSNEKEDILMEVRQLQTEYQEKLREHSQSTKQQEEQIELLRRQVQFKDTESIQLNQTFSELEIFSKRQLDVITQQQSTISRLEKIQEKSEDYKRLLESSKEDIQMIKSEFLSLVEKFKVTEEQVLEKDAQIVNQVKQIEVLEENIRGLTEEITATKKERETSNETVEELTGEIKEISNEKKELEGKIRTLEEQSQSLIENMNQLAEQHESSVDVNLELARQNDLLSKQLCIQTDHSTFYSKQVLDLETEIAKYRHLIQSNSSKISHSNVAHAKQAINNPFENQQLQQISQEKSVDQMSQQQQQQFSSIKIEENNAFISQQSKPNQNIINNFSFKDSNSNSNRNSNHNYNSNNQHLQQQEESSEYNSVQSVGSVKSMHRKTSDYKGSGYVGGSSKQESIVEARMNSITTQKKQLFTREKESSRSRFSLDQDLLKLKELAGAMKIANNTSIVTSP